MATKGKMDMMRSNSLRDMHKAQADGLAAATSFTRMGAFACGCCPLIYAAVMCGVYWSWMSKANEYDDSIPNWQGDISAFDTCGGLTVVSTTA